MRHTHHSKRFVLSIAVTLLVGVTVAAADGLPPAPKYILGTRITPAEKRPVESTPDQNADLKILPAPKNPVALSTEATPGSGGRSDVGELSETGQGKHKRGTALDALDPYIPRPGQWSLIPGSSIVPVLPTEAELGADFCEQIRCHRALSVLRAWNAIGYDEVNHCLWALAGGGHTDYGGNETYRYCLGTPLTGWERITEPAPLTRMVSTNPNCLAPAHGPMSSHTYDGVTWLPGTSKFFWLGTFGFCGRGMGPDSAWIFDSGRASWVEVPHLRQFARYARTGIDPLNGNILVFTSNTLRAIDPTSRQLKWATRPIGRLGDGTAIVHVQRREIYLLVTGAIYVAKLDVPPETIAIRKIANYPEIKSGSFGMAVHEPTGDIVMWDGKRTIYVYDPDSQKVKVLQPASQGPSGQDTGRVYSQWLYLPEKDVFVGVSASEGLWLWRRGTDEPAIPTSPTPQARAATLEKPAKKQVSLDRPAVKEQLPPDTSFAELCARAQTLLCDPLDDDPISGPAIKLTTRNLTMSDTINGRYGDWRWAWSKPNAVTPEIDSKVKADGQGSLKFTIASQSGPGGASLYTVAISPDASQGVGVGEGIRARLKVRWSCDVLYVDCNPASPTYKKQRRSFAVTKGAGGIKIFAIGEADRPREYLDSGEGLSVPVIGNYKQRGFFSGYISIWNEGIAQSYPKINGIRQWDLQPGGPRVCWKNDPASGFDLPNGWPDCYYLESDQWMTLQMDLLYGGCTKEVRDPALASRVRLWVAREGEPFELVIDQPVNIRCAPHYPDAKFGKIWITPYNTGKDPSEVHPEGYVWYDSLWVAKIAD